MSYLSVRNWDRYQHYKNRNPPWIKFYTAILEDDELRALPVATRLLWDQLLLLAGVNANVIRNDSELVAKLTGIPPRACREGIAQLVKGRWLRETTTPRRASTGAIKAASAKRSPDRERDKEKEVVSNGRNHVDDSGEPGPFTGRLAEIMELQVKRGNAS